MVRNQLLMDAKALLIDITDRILPELQAWRNRPLDAVYPIAWLDAIHYKVMDEKAVLSLVPSIMYWL